MEDEIFNNTPMPKNNKKNIIIAILITFIITFSVTNFFHNNILIYFPSRYPDKTFYNKLSVINRVIKDKYLYDVDEEELTENAITAYIEGLE